ncbi:FG-GAP repeat domain containing protein [Drechmeria coniospora]|uniref:FG-GAP repeat domain containing protein n=1 Tax=Drechmeria coniospora TaxID=98403 RepID=A0A151GBB4_DRECN|nr:FG-GAP repeat domain containing protein [Drechmeria coniospora]KYK54400.1 FG-GAP repeat domain containing protein [Drechmeria coniospora]ODA77316.1 hypothetical protein RJ55_06943 [Drechmeria coniospora]
MRRVSLPLVAFGALGGAQSIQEFPRNGSGLTSTQAIYQDGTVYILTEPVSANGLCDDKDFDAEPPLPLPARFTALDKMWQPAVDFDTDSCYNVPAIGMDGHIDRGRSRHESNTEGCRDEFDLDHSNVYSRQRCNNGWCAYVYDYFFEKDIGDRICIGHQYDWEHIIVWTKDGKPVFGAASAHGGYDARLWDDIPKQGTHVKVVYNKDGLIGTHYFRWSKGKTDEPPENHKGVWWLSDLLSWNGFPNVGLRNSLSAWDFGAATMAIRDDTLAGNLKKSVDAIRRKLPSFKFDFNLDDGSPGYP